MEEKQGEKQEIIKLRNHFTYIFEQMWRIVVLFSCILFSSEDSVKLGIELIRQGNVIQGLLAMGGAMLLMLLVCLWYINRWYRTTITIQDGTITSTKATLNRRVNTMSIANISNINLEQNLFEMIVGTYKMKMDTNSLSTADTTDLEIVLKKKDAEQVKQMILGMLREIEEAQETHSGEAPDMKNANLQEQAAKTVSPDAFDVMQGEYDITYSNQEIVKNGLITMSIMEGIVAVCLICSTIITVATIYQEEKDILVIISTIFLELIAAASIVADMVRKWLQDYHFRAKREKDKIYVSCGLLKKKSYVVPVDKINAVTLKYTFIGRICKRAYVKVINIGGQGEEADGVKLLLADSYEELERKLQILLPEFPLPEIKGMIKPPRKLLGIYGAGAFFNGLLAFLGVICIIFFGNDIGISYFGVGLFGLLVGGFGFYIRYMKYLASGILYSDSNFIISRGTFAKTIQTVPYNRIQYIHMNQGPVRRKFGLFEGYISILASAVSRTQYIGVFESREFTRLEERLRETY